LIRDLIGEAHSLKRLQLRYAVLYLALLLFSGAMGVIGLHLWSSASAERDRLSFMSAEALEMRGSLYRQIKEVFDHAFLNDVEAANEFADYARDIDRHFNLVYVRAAGERELAVVRALHAAYSGVRAYGDSLLSVPSSVAMSEGRRLDVQLERGAFHEFELSLGEFERVLLFERKRVDDQLSLLRQVVPALLTLPLLLATVIFVVFRRYLRVAVADPLVAIMDATRNISCGRLNHRVPETGAAELVRLAHAINSMAGDLAASREALLRAEKQATLGALVPVVAHNIRNPLASIRATAQVIDDDTLPGDVREGLAGIISTTDRLDRWTYSLLSYLHPLQPQRAPVNVAMLFDTVVDVARDRLDAAGIRLRRIGWDDACVVPLDLHLMEQALLALLNNAIEASPPDGTITLRHAHAGDGVLLSIRDCGSGMMNSPAPRGLSPLATTKVQGSGLGIPFAAKVCDVHGGRLEFIHHDRGTEAVVILPLE
jgi:signal transduction histidine kinase